MHKSLKRPSILLLFPVLMIASPVNADGLKFEAKLSGAQEVMEAMTPARGRIVAKFDAAFTRVRVDLRIRGLTGDFVGAHFHCNRAGLNGTVAFGLVNPGPLSLVGNRIRGTLTNADFNNNDCVPNIGRPVNNIAALAFAMRDGLIYVNVHSVPDFAAGEIRGQMLPAHDDDDNSDSDSD